MATMERSCNTILYPPTTPPPMSSSDVSRRFDSQIHPPNPSTLQLFLLNASPHASSQWELRSGELPGCSLNPHLTFPHPFSGEGVHVGVCAGVTVSQQAVHNTNF